MTDTTTPAAWPRPHWQPSGEQAVLLFFVFGAFPEDMVLPVSKYGSPGLPDGVELKRFQNTVLAKWEGYPLGGALGDLLRNDNPDAYAEAKAAPHVVAIRGRFYDRDSLDYLRDTLGVVAALLDIGGSKATVIDPQILSLFDAAAWRRHYLIEGGAPTRHHVLIMSSPEEGAAGRSWVRTRGMRKFGRPDISLANVPDSELNRAGALSERFVDLGALGAHFEHGQGIEVDGVPGGLVVTLSGDEDDATFNNSHVDMRWPD